MVVCHGIAYDQLPITSYNNNMIFEEKKIRGKRIFTGEVLELNLDEVQLPNGKKAEREWISHKGAVGIVPVAENGNLILVEQFRYPTGKTVIEIPAGKLDKGEKPQDCAVRELQEEIGMKCSEIGLLSTFYTSPGYSDELFYLFIATGLTPSSFDGDDDEFLNIIEMPFEEAFASVIAGKIVDGKTIAGILLAAIRLGRLRT